ncbi:MAG: hypothetical protein KF873_01960 [Gemmataceae bacterium]|nr:hypothetical protein [Gemmataceae bacterium]
MNRETRRSWYTLAAAVAAVAACLGIAAWYTSRITSPPDAPPPDRPNPNPFRAAVQIEQELDATRPPDLVRANHFGRIVEIRHQFFPLRDQPALGIVVTFADGRTIAFACRPSQLGPLADAVNTDARILLGERDGIRDWLIATHR